MRIMFFDKDFNVVGAVVVFNSLIWNRRYYEPGVFELHCSVEYFDLLYNSKYVTRNDRQELGVIREVNYKETDQAEREAYCKGYFAESLLNNRVIEKTVNLAGTPEDIGRTLMNTFIISPTDKDRKFPQIKLGARKGIGDRLSLQVTGQPLGDELYEIERTQEMSHRLLFDYESSVLTFETWKGLDRTDEQTVNSWAIFSNSFKNVKDVVYDRDDTDYKNYAYVAGEGEGTARTIVEIDLRKTADEERRELYVDARDLQSTYMDDDGVEHTIPRAEYLEKLRQRGLEKLAEYDLIETVSSDVEQQANLEYLVDYDLGDLCTYRNTEIGIECTKRITEIEEVYEGAKSGVNVTFGTDDVTTIQKIIKKETS